MIAKKSRIRCRACGRLVSFGLSVCPHCGHQPARLHTRWRASLLSVLFGLVLGLLLFPFAPHAQTDFLTIRVTATQRPVALARPTFTPTATMTPLPTATATATNTPAPTATATNTAVKVAQSAPTATSTSTLTPLPTVAPPKLFDPKDQTEYGGGAEAEIILRWDGTVQEGQQFAVTVRYISKSDATETRGAWTRDLRWRVDSKIFRDLSQTLRALKWDVTVIDAGGNALSPPSESRIFYWR